MFLCACFLTLIQGFCAGLFLDFLYLHFNMIIYYIVATYTNLYAHVFPLNMDMKSKNGKQKGPVDHWSLA